MKTTYLSLFFHSLPFLLSSALFNLFAQQVIIDENFEPQLFQEAEIQQIREMIDGRIVVAGDFDLVNGKLVSKITRLMPDGTIDTSFQLRPQIYGTVNDIILTEDEDIILGGRFLSTRFEATPVLLKIKKNGELDPTFQFDPTYFSWISKLQLVDGNHFLAMGETTNRKFEINKYDKNGKLVNSFVWPGSSGNLRILDFDITPDGGVVFSGFGTNFEVGGQSSRIIKLNNVGQIDTTFNLNANLPLNTYFAPSQIESFESGNILATWPGNVMYLDSVGNQLSHIRDDVRVVDHIVKYGVDEVLSVEGSMHLPEFYQHVYKYLFRISSDPMLGKSIIGSGHYELVGKINVIRPLKSGNVLVGGSFLTNRNQIVNSLLKVSVDNPGENFAFKSEFQKFAGITSMDVQSDGKILLAGNIDQVVDKETRRVVRINTDGTLDVSFSDNLPKSRGDIAGVHALDDGNVIVSGVLGTDAMDFPDFVNGLALLDNQGKFLSADTFGIKGFNGLSGRILLRGTDSKDRLYFGGSVTIVDPRASGANLHRLNSDLSFDVDFSNRQPLVSGLKFFNGILNPSEDSFILYGFLIDFDNLGTQPIVKFDKDENVDFSFSIDNTDNLFFSSATLDDQGNIYFGGRSLTANLATTGRFMKLNPTGAIDNNFSIGIAGQKPGILIPPYVTLVKHIDNIEQILIDGNYSNYNGENIDGPLLVSSDGATVNSLFGDKFKGSVEAIYDLGNGEYYIAGPFSIETENGLIISLAKIKFLITSTKENRRAMQSLNLHPNPVNDHLLINTEKLPLGNYQYEIFDVNGQQMISSRKLHHLGFSASISLHSLQNGTYYIRVSNKEKIWIGKFVKIE